MTNNAYLTIYDYIDTIILNLSISDIFNTHPNLLQHEMYISHEDITYLTIYRLSNEIESLKPKNTYFRYIFMPTATIDYISKNILQSHFEYDYDRDNVNTHALFAKSVSIDENTTLSEIVDLVINISKERNEPNIYWYKIYKNDVGYFVQFATA